MRKKQRRQFQAKKNEQPVTPGGAPQRETALPQDDLPQMAPDFSYLFDQSAQEGLEYELDQEQIHADRVRRVEQVTAEFPSLRDEELFSYFEQGGEPEDGALYTDIEEDSSATQDYAAQDDDHKYHTIPIFNDSNNPFSLHSQGVQEPMMEALYEELDDSEESLAEWSEEPEHEDEDAQLIFSDADELEPEDSNLSLYDDHEYEADTRSDELTTEEAYWSGPINMEPIPEPVQGEGFVKASVRRPQRASTVSAPDNSFVMPERYDEEEYADGTAALPQTEPVVSAHFFDVEDTDLYSNSVVGTLKDLDPDITYGDDLSDEEEGDVYNETEHFEAAPANVYIEDTNASPDFLQESPELVTFPSLAEDPRRNQPRLSALDGLTRYLSDDEADVSPKFYEDDDFDDQALAKTPADEDSLFEEGEQPEQEFDPDDLPSRKFLGGDHARPQTREELNDLKAHIYHSDIGVRKHHITIANLFDVLTVERKLYVKYHPRQAGAHGAHSAKNTTAAARETPGKRPLQKAPPKADRAADRQPDSTGAQDDFGEYKDSSDASKIRTELRRDIRMSGKTALFTGIIALVSLFFTSAETLGISLPSFMRVSESTTGFLIVNTLLLAGAIFLNFDTIWESIKRLIAFEFDSDTAVSTAAVFCFLQNILMFFDIQSLADGRVHIYSAIACMGFSLHTAGKLLIHKRTQKNFRFAASSRSKKSVRLVTDPEYSRQVAGEITNGEPIIAYQTETGFLTGFLKLSYAVDPSEESSKKLTPFLMIASAVVGLIAGIVLGSFTEGLAAAAAALCASIPMTNLLCINLPLFLMSKKLLKEGVLLTSSASVQEYSEVNGVMLDAVELFPEGSLLLHGVKNFCDQPVERVMAEVSSVVCSLDGPLKDLFLSGMKDMLDLTLVEGRVEYTHRLGFGAFIDGLPVFVGTADWIRRQGILLPERKLTEKHSANGRDLLYYAKGDKLIAFFALSHVPDPTIVQTMFQYEQAGGSFVIRSTDPFITERTVSDWFGVGNRSVRILSPELGAYYSEIMQGTEGRFPAFLATTGRLSSFFRAINACVRAKLNFTLAVMLQAAAMVLGVVLVALFSLISGVSGLSVVNLLIFLLFWLFATLVAPTIRKT